MSFKCSVFGHRYGDPEVEREREEQGSEVVITIKETETCKRCGETRVVSENKEVTTLETPSDIVEDDLADTAGADQPSADPAATEPDTQERDGEPAATSPVEPNAEPDVEPVEEPAGADGPGGDDDQSTGPEREDHDAETDDAVILDADETEEDGDDREPGEWPDEPEQDDDWAPSTDQDLQPVEDEQPDVEPTSDAVTVPEGEFYCPECDFVTSVESSSLRAGDFCPECHRGSLEHRTE